jgi:hypothetical protein
MMLSSPLTLIDATSVQGSFAEVLWAITTNALGMNDESSAMAPDAKELFWKPASEFLFPWLRDPIQSYIQSVGGDSGHIPYGTKMRPTNAEAAIIETFISPWAGAYVGKNNETGKLEADTWAVKGLRTFVPILPGYMSVAYFDNPEIIAYRGELDQAKMFRERAAGASSPEQKAELIRKAQNLEKGARGHRTKAFLYAFRNYSGLRSYAYSLEAQKSYKRRDIKRQMDQHLPKTSAAIGDQIFTPLPIEYDEHD